MKHIFQSVLMILLFLSLATPAFASHYDNGPSSYRYGSYSPYRNYFEQSAFTSDSSINRDDYSFSNSFLDRNSDLFSRDYHATSDYDRLFSDNLFSTEFQDSLQDSDLQFSDGYALTKGPCMTKTLHANFDGKDNDFTLTSSVCDNIQGNFYRDNRVDSQQRNSYGFTNDRAYSDSFSDSSFVDDLFTQDRDRFTEQNSQETGSSRFLETSFGKGTLIILR